MDVTSGRLSVSRPVSSGHVLGSHDLFSCWPGRTRRGATPSCSAPPSCACTYFGQRVKRSGSRVSSSGRRISGLGSRSLTERQHCTHLAPDATVSTPGKDHGMALVIMHFGGQESFDVWGPGVEASDCGFKTLLESSVRVRNWVLGLQTRAAERGTFITPYRVSKQQRRGVGV